MLTLIPFLLLTSSQQISCSNCRVLMLSASIYVQDPEFLEKVDQVADQICSFPFMPTYCKDFATSTIQIISESLLQRYINPNWSCNYILGSCDTPVYQPISFQSWAQQLLQNAPRPISPSTSSSTTKKFVQMTDLQIDPNYVVGASTDCGEEICCHGTKVEKGAGQFGDYNCDLPIGTFQKALEFLAGEDLEFVMLTGNLSPHNYEMNRSEKMNLIKEITQEFENKLAGVPVYPIFGHQDCSPDHQFNFRDTSTLTFELGNLWRDWIGSDFRNFKENSYYSAVHKQTNLRIIVLNTLACDIENFYLVSNVTDPGDQIYFLETTLARAEAYGEQVYIMSHIPPASSACLGEWASYYSVLVERYSNTIKGQFFGHTHMDEIRVNKAFNSGVPTGIQFVAPSLTTYKNRNPSFRIYEYDPVSMTVVNYSQYRLDLMKEEPEFEKVYDFNGYYLTSSLTPQSVNQLAHEIQGNHLVALKYIQNQFSGSPKTPKTCDQQCQNDIFCQISNDNWDDQRSCMQLPMSYNEIIRKKFLGNWFTVVDIQVNHLR